MTALDRQRSAPAPRRRHAGPAAGRIRQRPQLAGHRRSCCSAPLYCLFPVLWVLIASTKNGAELFSTFTFAPSTHLFGQHRAT